MLIIFDMFPFFFFLITKQALLYTGMFLDKFIEFVGGLKIFRTFKISLKFLKNSS